MKRQQKLKISTQQDRLLKTCKDCPSTETELVAGEYICSVCWVVRVNQAKKLSKN